MKTYKPLVVRSRILEYASRPEPTEFNPRAMGAVVGRLNRAISVRTNDHELIASYRQLVIAWVTLQESQVLAPRSSKTLTAPEWNGLAKWMQEYTPGIGWHDREAFYTECAWVCTRAILDYEKSQASIAKGETLPLGYFIEQWRVYDQTQTVELDEGGLLSQAIMQGGVLTAEGVLPPANTYTYSPGAPMVELMPAEVNPQLALLSPPVDDDYDPYSSQ